MILGLDASSSCIGWTILSDDLSVVDIGHLDLKRFEDLYEKADCFARFMDDIYGKGPFSKVFIEEPVKVYSTSTANVIGLLQRWNGMVSLIVRYHTSRKPILISSHESRKACSIKVPRGIDTKQFIWENIKSRNVIAEDFWEYKKTGKPKDYCYDMADSYVVALGGALIYGIEK